ncbi:signal peptidase I [Actinomycetes bacterium KLBMP 9759]
MNGRPVAGAPPVPPQRRGEPGPARTGGDDREGRRGRGGPSGDPPPRRRAPEPETDPEPPTTAVPAVAAAVSEVPGRHRRRAGESPEGRPASEYQADADAAGGRRKPRTGRRRRPAFWKELPLLIVVALLLTFLIQTFLAKVYVIPSGSMETTLHGCTGCNNDRVLVDKLSYRFTDPAPGDVVVFRGPDSWNSEFTVDEPTNPVVRGLQQLGSLIGLAPPDEKDFVKRIIAVGGQTVQCCDSRQRVLVDNQPLNEPYIYYAPSQGPPRQQPFGPVVVPAGHLWMMGDSRNNSADSRMPGHGAVPVENVIGKARLIVLPFPRFGWIPAFDPHSNPVGMAAPGADAPVALSAAGLLPLLAMRRRRARADRDDFLPGYR